MTKPISLQTSNTERFDLHAVADELEHQDAFAASRRSAATLVKGEDLTVVLTTATKGEIIREHAAPRSAIVVVLQGHVVVRFPAEEEHLRPGESVAFAANLRHSVEVLEDARFLVVIGGQAEPTHLAE